MPMPNFHSFQMKTPGMFKEIAGQEGKFRTKSIADGITILVGRLKRPKKGQENSGVVQTYRFDATKYSFNDGKKWMRDHKLKYRMAEKAIGVKPNEKKKTKTKGKNEIDRKANTAVGLSDLAERLKRDLDKALSISGQ